MSVSDKPDGTGVIEQQPNDRIPTERTPLVLTPNEAEKGNGKIEAPPSLPDYDPDLTITPEIFQQLVNEVRYAISIGVYPTMIVQGSSGSYFCRDRQGKIVGVFKPKNEEPYGKMNPKWAKWLQRTCCPCCFGRGCLIPNTGYISEASASLLDHHLGLDIVPRTELVSLASPTFSYSYFDRRKKPLPEKMGSFQIFVRGYRDATICIKEFQTVSLTENLQYQFRLNFERLVILDYLIRNTDRGNDNWLIKIDHPRNEEAAEDEWEQVSLPFLKIAAIDNGLAFPFKHPDSWRAYPFAWANLAPAKIAFSEETKAKFLPKLLDPDWCETLTHELRGIAQADPDFNEGQFKKQMALIRGQIFNVTEAMIKQKSPAELVEMTPRTIRHEEGISGIRRRFMSTRLASPFFKTW